jgi:hypothetical protein
MNLKRLLLREIYMTNGFDLYVFAIFRFALSSVRSTRVSTKWIEELSKREGKSINK